MTAREFLRRRWAERRQTSFIPIVLFGFQEFEPVTPRPGPLSGRVEGTRPTAGGSGQPPAAPTGDSEP